MNLEFGLISLMILVFSAILHEIAHGWVADRLGDPTARLLGRLTLNPLPHIDLWMSILLPLTLILSGSPIIFGAAKPVPIDPFNFRDQKKDTALVALAGPITNFLIAAFFALILRFSQGIILDPFISVIVFRIVTLNLLLGIFNLLPIPPLDGSKFFAMFLPPDLERSYLSIGTFGFLILFFLLMPFSPIPLNTIISQLLTFCLRLLGL